MTAGAIILVLRSKCRLKKLKGIVLGALQLICKPEDMLTAFATSVLVLQLVLPQRMVTLKVRHFCDICKLQTGGHAKGEAFL